MLKELLEAVSIGLALWLTLTLLWLAYAIDRVQPLTPRQRNWALDAARHELITLCAIFGITPSGQPLDPPKARILMERALEFSQRPQDINEETNS